MGSRSHTYKYNMYYDTVHWDFLLHTYKYSVYYHTVQWALFPLPINIICIVYDSTMCSVPLQLGTGKGVLDHIGADGIAE